MKFMQSFWILNINFKKIFLIYDDLLFLPYSFMSLLFAFTYLWIAWYIPPLIPYSNIKNILISVKNYKFTFFLFKAACHINPGTQTKWAGSSLYSLRHAKKVFICISWHILCHFERKNDDIYQSILFQNLSKLFSKFLHVICSINIVHI